MTSPGESIALQSLLERSLSYFNADSATLTFPDGMGEAYHLGVLLPGMDEVEFLQISDTSMPCSDVIRTGQAASIPAVRLTLAGRGCGFMRAEGLNSYLGAPIPANRGTIIGALAVQAMEERIWSRSEFDEIRRLGIVAADSIRSIWVPSGVYASQSVTVH